MISPTGVESIGAATYAAAFLVLLWRLRSVARGWWRFCSPLLAVIGTAAVATVLDVAAVGTIPVGAETLSLPTVLEGMFAYGVVWGTCGWLADVDRRTLTVVVGIPMIQVFSFHAAVVIGPTAARLGAAFVVVGYLVLAYLMLGPIWTATGDLPRARRLLHWKCRNLLLFLTGVLILFATIAVTITLSTFVATVLTVYIEMLIRIGIAGFIFANVSRLQDATGDGTVSDAEASPAARAAGG